MKPNLAITRAVFAVAATFLFSHCAKHSKVTHGDGKAAIAQGPGLGIGASRSATRELSSGRVRNAEQEVPGLAPIVQAPGPNDAAILRPAR